MTLDIDSALSLFLDVCYLGRLCGPKRDAFSSERTQLTDEDTQPLMGDVAVHVPASVRSLYQLLLTILSIGSPVSFKAIICFFLSYTILELVAQMHMYVVY